MSLDEMLVEKRKRDDECKKLEEELAELRAEIPTLEKAMESAAENGDVASYSAARKAKENNEDSIFVKDTVLKKMKGVKAIYSREEVITAWEEHIAAYNKKFKKKSFELEKTIEMLYKQYEAMLTDQSEMLKLRRECISLFGGLMALGTADRMYADVLKAEMMPKLHCPGLLVYKGYQFADILTPMFWDFGVIEKEKAVVNARVVDGMVVETA